MSAARPRARGVGEARARAGGRAGGRPRRGGRPRPPAPAPNPTRPPRHATRLSPTRAHTHTQPRALRRTAPGRATDDAAPSPGRPADPEYSDPPRARGTRRGAAATRGEARSGGRRRGVPRAAAGARVPGARPRARLGLGASRPDRAKGRDRRRGGRGGCGPRTRGGGPGGVTGERARPPGRPRSPPGARRRDRRRSGSGPSPNPDGPTRPARGAGPRHHTPPTHSPGDPKTACGARDLPQRDRGGHGPQRELSPLSRSRGRRRPPRPGAGPLSLPRTTHTSLPPPHVPHAPPTGGPGGARRGGAERAEAGRGGGRRRGPGNGAEEATVSALRGTEGPGAEPTPPRPRAKPTGGRGRHQQNRALREGNPQPRQPRGHKTPGAAIDRQATLRQA